MSEAQIMLVCRQCMERCAAGSTWPPDLAEFVALVSASGASGSFHGTIDATDGIFRGSVEANSFIGDIAAMSTFPGKSGSTWKSRIMHHDSSNKGGKSYAISGLIRWEAGNKSGYVTVDCYVNGQRVSTASYNGTDSGESARMRITACGVATGISTRDTLVEIVVSGTGTCHLEAGYCVMSRGSGSWEAIA